MYAPNSSAKSAFSTSSSPTRALVAGEKLTFSEVSDDLITTKPKGQSNFQNSSFLNLFAAFVTFNHLLFLKMFSDLSSDLYLVESSFLHCVQYTYFSHSLKLKEEVYCSLPLSLSLSPYLAQVLKPEPETVDHFITLLSGAKICFVLVINDIFY